jgi:hypothetical protein
MTGSFPVADHLRCLASASSDILTNTLFLVTAFWDKARGDLDGLGETTLLIKAVHLLL